MKQNKETKPTQNNKTFNAQEGKARSSDFAMRLRRDKEITPHLLKASETARESERVSGGESGRLAKGQNIEHPTSNAEHRGGDGREKAQEAQRAQRPAPVEVMIDVEVVIDEPILERVMALFYPVIARSIICPEHGSRFRNWRRKRCELNLPNSTPHPSSQWLPKPTTSQVPDMGKSLRDPWSPIEAERVCKRVMRKTISTELLLRLIYASPEQFAAVERILGIKTENGAESVLRDA